ncbi:hypothetical protein [Silvanigrella aquatica]|uniref:hypothetical protein n=1 Tax=Silvanigrella aquatica TaxID=1915309 RepID=UPI001E28AB51|nr:hypothetical protein [Silvanigrella aquatica]
MGKSKYAEGNIKKTCYEYQNIVVAEWDDPGLKGGVKIGISFKNKKYNKVNPCEKKLKNFNYRLQPEGYFSGKVGDFFVMQGPDSFGGAVSFEIYKFEKKKIKLLFEDVLESENGLHFYFNENKNVGARYWKMMKQSSVCSLLNDKTSVNCWNQILFENNVKNNVSLKKCVDDIKRSEQYKTTENIENFPIQTFINIELTNLNQFKIFKVLNQEPNCHISP